MSYWLSLGSWRKGYQTFKPSLADPRGGGGEPPPPRKKSSFLGVSLLFDDVLSEKQCTICLRWENIWAPRYFYSKILFFVNFNPPPPPPHWKARSAPGFTLPLTFLIWNWHLRRNSQLKMKKNSQRSYQSVLYLIYFNPYITLLLLTSKAPMSTVIVLFLCFDSHSCV